MAITEGPLKGVRIIDLSQNFSGPFGTMLLGDLGAEIIKLESPQGDPTRNKKREVDLGDYQNLSLNRNKKSIVLDIESPQSRKAFSKLVKTADVVYSNFPPDTLIKLGLDLETLKKVNPDIIQCNISGFGKDGPYRNLPCEDIIVSGYAGILSLSGEDGRLPVTPGGISLAEISGGIFAVLSILSSLIYQNREKKAVEVDTNLFNSMLILEKVFFQNMFGTGVTPGLQGRRHHLLPTYGIFKTKDGHITIGPSDDKKLTNVIGLEWMENDPKFNNTFNRMVNKDEFTRHFEKTLLTKTTSEWLRIIRDENDLAAGPVLNYEQIINDPQICENKIIREMELRGEKYKTIGSIFKMPGIIAGEAEPAPDLGQHTEEILKDILHYSDDQIGEILDEVNRFSIPD